MSNLFGIDGFGWGDLIGIGAPILGGIIAGNSDSEFFTGPDPNRGYQGGIPDYTGIRGVVPNTYDPNRRPGSGGQRYFTDMQYVPSDDPAAITDAYNSALAQAGGLEVLNMANPAQEQRFDPNWYLDGGVADAINAVMANPDWTDEEKIQQIIAGMDHYNISPYMLSEATGVPVNAIYQIMNDYGLSQYNPVFADDALPGFEDRQSPVGSTTPDDTVPDDTVPDDTVPDDTVPDDTVPDDTVPDSGIPEDNWGGDVGPDPNDYVVPESTWDDTWAEDTTGDGYMASGIAVSQYTGSPEQLVHNYNFLVENGYTAEPGTYSYGGDYTYGMGDEVLESPLWSVDLSTVNDGYLEHAIINNARAYQQAEMLFSDLFPDVPFSELYDPVVDSRLAQTASPPNFTYTYNATDDGGTSMTGVNPTLEAIHKLREEYQQSGGDPGMEGYFQQEVDALLSQYESGALGETANFLGRIANHTDATGNDRDVLWGIITGEFGSGGTDTGTVPDTTVGGFTAPQQAFADYIDTFDIDPAIGFSPDQVASVVAKAGEEGLSLQDVSTVTGLSVQEVQGIVDQVNYDRQASYFNQLLSTPNLSQASYDAAVQYIQDNNISAETIAQMTGLAVEDVAAALGAAGVTGYAGGGLIAGNGDGMADDVPTDIGADALISQGEYVIPADVVSHLGNGNSDSGAKVLDEMLGRVRMARTGTPSQGRQINPHQMLPY